MLGLDKTIEADLNALDVEAEFMKDAIDKQKQKAAKIILNRSSKLTARELVKILTETLTANQTLSYQKNVIYPKLAASGLIAHSISSEYIKATFQTYPDRDFTMKKIGELGGLLDEVTSALFKTPPNPNAKNNSSQFQRFVSRLQEFENAYDRAVLVETLLQISGTPSKLGHGEDFVEQLKSLHSDACDNLSGLLHAYSISKNLYTKIRLQISEKLFMIKDQKKCACLNLVSGWIKMTDKYSLCLGYKFVIKSLESLPCSDEKCFCVGVIPLMKNLACAAQVRNSWLMCFSMPTPKNYKDAELLQQGDFRGIWEKMATTEDRSLVNGKKERLAEVLGRTTRILLENFQDAVKSMHPQDESSVGTKPTCPPKSEVGTEYDKSSTVQLDPDSSSTVGYFAGFNDADSTHSTDQELNRLYAELNAELSGSRR